MSSKVRKSLYALAAVLGLLAASAVVVLFAPGQKGVDDYEIRATVREAK